MRRAASKILISFAFNPPYTHLLEYFLSTSTFHPTMYSYEQDSWPQGSGVSVNPCDPTFARRDDAEQERQSSFTTLTSEKQLDSGDNFSYSELILVPDGDTFNILPGNSDKRQKNPECRRDFGKASFKRTPHAQTTDDGSTARAMTLDLGSEAVGDDADLSPVGDLHTLSLCALFHHPHDTSSPLQQETTSLQASFARNGTASLEYSIQSHLPADITPPTPQWHHPNQVPLYLSVASARTLGYSNNFLTGDASADPSYKMPSTYAHSFQNQLECRTSTTSHACHAATPLSDPAMHFYGTTSSSLTVTANSTSINLCNHEQSEIIFFQRQCGCSFTFNTSTFEVEQIYQVEINSSHAPLNEQERSVIHHGQLEPPRLPQAPSTMENNYVVDIHQASSYSLPGSMLVPSALSRHDRPLIDDLTIPVGSLRNDEFREPPSGISVSTAVSIVSDPSTPASAYFSPQSARSNTSFRNFLS